MKESELKENNYLSQIQDNDKVLVIIKFPQIVTESKEIFVTKDISKLLIEGEINITDFISKHLTTYEENNLGGSLEGAVDSGYAYIKVNNK